jgi:DNA processing protein
MAKSLTHCGSAEAVLKPSLPTWPLMVWVRCYLETWKPGCFDKANVEMEFIRSNEINVVHFQGENYPRDWSIVSTVLCCCLPLEKIDLKNRKIIIVGTRQITSYGTEFCRKLIEDLAPLDPIIVSGFAYGVDIGASIGYGTQLTDNWRRSSWFKPNLSQNPQKYVAKVEQNGGFMSSGVHQSRQRKLRA